MRLYLFYIIIPFLAYPFLTTNCQKDYRNGNEAYYYEKKMGFNPVTIGRGNTVYTYDHANKLYINGDQILIPDLDTTPDGSTINKNEFYGFGLGGNATDTAFQWDAQYLISQPNKFDVVNMFVSPLSSNTMSYGKAIQTNGNSCNYGDCYAIVDGPVETLAYSDYNPKNDTFDLWAGEDLINTGDLKGNGIAHQCSQQQLDSTENISYCVKKYGRGWRLPTDIEVGHPTDVEGVNGMDSAYMGVSTDYMWTSSLFKTYTVKRWVVGISNHKWENCTGFIYTANRVRCVFPNFSNSTEANPTHSSQNPGFSVYPNPFKNYLNIEIEDQKFQSYQFIVSDIQGNEILGPINISSDQYKFDTKNIKEGIYFIKFTKKNNSQPIIYKIIKR